MGTIDKPSLLRPFPTNKLNRYAILAMAQQRTIEILLSVLRWRSIR